MRAGGEIRSLLWSARGPGGLAAGGWEPCWASLGGASSSLSSVVDLEPSWPLGERLMRVGEETVGHRSSQTVLAGAEGSLGRLKANGVDRDFEVSELKTLSRTEVES